MVRNQKVGVFFHVRFSQFLFFTEMRKAELSELLTSVGLKHCCAGGSPGCEKQALTLMFTFCSPELVWFWSPRRSPGWCQSCCGWGGGRGGQGLSVRAGMGLTHPGNPAGIHPKLPPQGAQMSSSLCCNPALSKDLKTVPAQWTLILFNHPVFPQFAWILNIWICIAMKQGKKKIIVQWCFTHLQHKIVFHHKSIALSCSHFFIHVFIPVCCFSFRADDEVNVWALGTGSGQGNSVSQPLRFPAWALSVSGGKI